MFIIDIFQKEENKNTYKLITRDNLLTFYDYPFSSFFVFLPLCISNCMYIFFSIYDCSEATIF